MKLTIWLKGGGIIQRSSIKSISSHDGMLFLDFEHTVENYYLADIHEYSIIL